jgi:hypothetical protein
MKKLIALALLALSFQSMAEMVEYSGSNKGAACTVTVDLAEKYVSMGNEGVFARKVKTKDNVTVYEGGAEFTNSRITLTFNKDKELYRAKLETKNAIKFFYTTKLICTNLVIVK